MRKLGLAAVVLVLVGCGGSASPAARAPSGAAFESGGAAAYPAAPMAAPGGGDLAPAAGSPAPAMESASAAVADKASSSAPAARDRDRAESDSRAPVARQRLDGLLTAGVWDDAKNFDFFQGYASKLRARGDAFDVFTKAELAAAQERARSTGNAKRKRELDVQIVFDTTGSMGDELSYVQSEITTIASRLRERLPDVVPRWSLVFYRDKGDEYVTRPYQFSTDTAQVARAIGAQQAGGGGDYPEAVVAGLETAASMAWRVRDDVAKVAFWIADAPTHSGEEGQAFGTVVRRMAKMGVHVYPIAASGADELTELQMRSAAVMTGGRYLFLTDDSGVGNSHAEPHIPCYAVTKLDAAIVRMLEIEVRGEHRAPAKNEIVRAVGDPRPDGTCKLPSGALVAAY